MKNSETNILLIGIGNCGRADDGLGWALLDKLENDLPQNWQVEYRYQLQIEDAELISKFDRVYFVDSDLQQHTDGYNFKKITAKAGTEYTSHQLDPEVVLHLCETIYDTYPKAFVLGIAGMDFSLKVGISKKAIGNLEKATTFFKNEILEIESNLLSY